jgi:flagella basal body P-ring formation protein FlgA
VLERPGRLMPREAVQDAVRAALVAAGASPDCDIDLLGYQPPIIPVETTATAIVAGLDYDRTAGRFAATLSVAGPGMAPATSRIVGRADDMTEVPVATTRLATGTVIAPGDIRIARIRTSLTRDMAETTAAIIGRELRHSAIAGQPLRTADLAAPALVQKGGSVQMRLENNGIALTGQGQALEAGGLGARIHVLNTSSRAMLEAEVTGIGQVRVRAETTPIVPGLRGAPPDYRAQLAGR